MKQEIIAVTVRPISNFDGFNSQNFHVSHWVWGFKQYMLVTKAPEAFEKLKDLASSIEEICVGFINTNDESEKFPVVERLEDSGLYKFVFFNAAPCEEQEADVHVVYKTKHDFIKYDQYLKFEQGSIA